MEGSIKQVALIVEDLEKTMNAYWDIMGVGPFQKNHFTPSTSHDLYVYGEEVKEDYHFCCACSWNGNIEYELIKPYVGPDIYWSHLKDYGPGLHHFKIVIPDNDKLKAYVGSLEKKGMTVLQTGWIDHDVHYYVDSKSQLGMILELGNGGAIRKTEDIYPSDDAVPEVSHKQNVAEIGIVVDSAEHYAKNWSELVETSQWTAEYYWKESENTFVRNDSDLHDQDAFVRMESEAGGMKIVLIQPLAGESIYSKFLKKHGCGFFSIEDVQPKEVAEDFGEHLEKAGIGVIQKEVSSDRVRYCYDTEKQFAVQYNMCSKR